MALREIGLALGINVDKQGEQAAVGAMDKIKKAAALAAGAFAAFKGAKIIKGIVDEVRVMADEIGKTSTQLGFGVEALQEFRFAADLAGVSGSEFSDTVKKLQKNAFEAADGNIIFAETFKSLGVNVNDSNGELKSGEQLIIEMADGMAGLDNETERVAIAMRLMGRSGGKLCRYFKRDLPE